MNPLRAGRHVVLAAVLLAAGCRDDLLRPTEAASGVQVRLELSDPQAAGGGRVAIVIRAEAANGMPLTGLQGTLRYDPTRLRYAGQLRGTFMVRVGEREADHGSLRVLSFEPGGLPHRTAVLEFDVLGAGWARTLGYAFETATTRDLSEVFRAVVLPTQNATELALRALPPRRTQIRDWRGVLARQVPGYEFAALWSTVTSGRVRLTLRLDRPTLIGATTGAGDPGALRSLRGSFAYESTRLRLLGCSAAADPGWPNLEWNGSGPGIVQFVAEATAPAPEAGVHDVAVCTFAVLPGAPTVLATTPALTAAEGADGRTMLPRIVITEGALTLP